ncbi:hypothetical protein MGYG_04728 [Nannizzia gypsea CBS 118893]|uniref:Uncharacterized protein n=1 Tax=Arthroderma gypseum (strain ATCC MYA-4604 / CBS 118893) TaxID=535722 RepID=E4UWH1_ARTGP|nr:hypothetical protein MGYG_04728 [Nannizzia gypsea CBS 118893]EFR01727.1 hypothetical protein MGYG_04728 [Nannizzia gypsea CBS 118893]
MARISSRTYIRLHALFQVVLAVYLTFSRESVGGSELVYKVRDRLRIDNIQPFNLPRSPFAYCGILLLSFALFDLTLAIKLPTLNHVLAVAEFIHRQQLRQQQERQQRESLLQSRASLSSSTALPPPIISRSRLPYTRPPTSRSSSASSTTSSGSGSSTSTELNEAALKITAEFSSLYRQLCILLVTLRSWIFMIVSLRIYLSPDTEWGAASTAVPSPATIVGMPATSTLVAGSVATPFQSAAGKTILWLDQNMHFTRAGLSTAAAVSGSTLGYDVNDLKRKIVLGYGVLELMFSCWILFALRHEKKQAENQLRSVGIGVGADIIAAMR